MEHFSFHQEDTNFSVENQDLYTNWLTQLISSHAKLVGELAYIFCSDSYLLKLNKEHLNHDTFTDIITFDYTNAGIISGDIFISIDRIKENAAKFSVTFDEELQRVMAHGVLHLIGFKDKSEKDKAEMRTEENKALALFKSIS